MNLLYLQDSFSISEMACIISSTDPIEVEICQNDTNFTQNYSHYLTALNFIRNLIDNGTLDYTNYTTKADQFKSMLNSKGIVIDGFNSNIELTKANNEHELSQDETQKTNSEYEPSQDEINHLTTELQQAHGEIDRLKAELEQAQALLAEKQKNEYAQSVQVVDNEPLHPKTKTSHEKLIAVLASMAKLDFDKPFSNYDSLCLQSELLGMDNFLNKDTLAKLLNNAHKHINNSK